MRSVTYGESITFTKEPTSWMDVDFDGDFDYDDVSLFYGDPVITLEILKTGGRTIYGPFTEEDLVDPVIVLAGGTLSYTFTVPSTAVPGVYSARWIFELGPHVEYELEEFEVTEPVVTPSDPLDPPRTYGIIRESSSYLDMGQGLTDQLFLIGHGDGIGRNDPYQVRNVQEAINLLGGDEECPLIRGLLEAYNAGARDIWLVSAAPMAEYIPFTPTDTTSRNELKNYWGNDNFWGRYYERLITTYEILQEYDYPDIVVPLEASYYGTGDVDFLTQLTEHCWEGYARTQSPRLGILGTRIGSVSEEIIETLITDSRLGAYNTPYHEKGKFGMILMGEATFVHPQTTTPYVRPVDAYAAGILASNQLDRGLTYSRFSHSPNIIGRDLTDSEIVSLARARVNPLIRTKKGRRGTPYNAVLASDNTLAAEFYDASIEATRLSDYWTVVPVRLVYKVIRHIRALGWRHMGTVGYPQFEREVRSYLEQLASLGVIQSYDLFLERDYDDPYQVNVEVGLKPYYGLREIYFQVEVGPGVTGA